MTVSSTFLALSNLQVKPEIVPAATIRQGERLRVMVLRRQKHHPYSRTAQSAWNCIVFAHILKIMRNVAGRRSRSMPAPGGC
jgi:hypothetical protein